MEQAYTKTGRIARAGESKFLFRFAKGKETVRTIEKGVLGVALRTPCRFPATPPKQTLAAPRFVRMKQNRTSFPHTLDAKP